MEHIKPQNVGQFTPDHEHEDSDINVRAVLGFAAFLVLMAIVIHVGLWFVYRGLDKWAERMDPPANPMVMQEQKAGSGRVGDVQSTQGAEDVQQKMRDIVTTFPEPRLQPDEVRDMDLFRQKQERDLHGYGKVDASGQTVRIPVERAMEIIAERGLPNFGTAPAAAKPAAQRAQKAPAKAGSTSQR